MQISEIGCLIFKFASILKSSLYLGSFLHLSMDSLRDVIILGVIFLCPVFNTFLKLNKNIFEFMGSETVIKFTSYKELSKCKVILPPLQVQNRIVEQLDNIYENEIESSKEVIKYLQFSIETIIKNSTTK